MSRPPVILNSFGQPAKLATSRAYSGGHAPGGYRAAAFSRDRRHIHNAATDSSRDITAYTRTQISRIARVMAKNNGMVKGLKLDFIKYVIGPGIFPYANTGDVAIDEAYDDWFEEWAQIADLTGRMSFWDMQRAREANRFIDGDVFTVLTEKPSGYPQLKLIRAHNCRSDGEDGYTDGVKIDRHGAPHKFKFLQKDGTFRVLPARSVDHSLIMEDGDEVRQLSALHAAIEHCQDMDEIKHYEKLAQKDHARISRVIKAHSDNFDPTDDDMEAELEGVVAGGPRDMASIPTERVVGAELIRLQLGEEMQSFASDRPSPAFQGFLMMLGREVNAGTGWRYEFSWDSSAVKGPGYRGILDACARTARLRQSTEQRTTHRLRNYAIARAIELGDLPAHPNWYKADYIPGAVDPTIDKGKDGALELNQIAAGLLTKKEYHGRRGLNWRRVEAQILKEAEHAKALGLDPDTTE